MQWIGLLAKSLGDNEDADQQAKHIVDDLGAQGPVQLAKFNGCGTGMQQGERLINAMRAMKNPPEKKVKIKGAKAGEKDFYMEPSGQTELSSTLGSSKTA